MANNFTVKYFHAKGETASVKWLSGLWHKQLVLTQCLTNLPSSQCHGLGRGCALGDCFISHMVIICLLLQLLNAFMTEEAGIKEQGDEVQSVGEVTFTLQSQMLPKQYLVYDIVMVDQ